jgi:hypothetical protein
MPAAGGAFEPIRRSQLDDDRAALFLGAILLLESGLAETFLELDLSGTGPRCEPLRASTKSLLFIICTLSELAEGGA